MQAAVHYMGIIMRLVPPLAARGACMTSSVSATFSVQEQFGFSRLVMVGDGATDLEARQPGGADIFIGYGGVVERPSVASKADWYIYNIRDLIEAMP